MIWTRGGATKILLGGLRTKAALKNLLGGTRKNIGGGTLKNIGGAAAPPAPPVAPPLLNSPEYHPNSYKYPLF